MTTPRANEYEAYLLGNMQALRMSAGSRSVPRGPPRRERLRGHLVLGIGRGDVALCGQGSAAHPPPPRDKELLIELPEGVQVLDIR